ncbi:NAD(P)-binding domain-containing protein [Nocardiopsis sp. N85]|uniref:NAD(P)-dependent oxidoreductase n=1 Tax=Nocardiopsis sp. N85 TaxID=3029400 RepID=UPI00237F2A41|nr:NAD(P)-binding domain-containing protein [Nocardiopsis sp. N85]MDE3722079.1 NAD(P)-binding domain-containing protein [Nocardiopsis sp. N85]
MAQERRGAVTVIGLGLMGSALARAFVRAGHPTTVWNRSPDKAAPLVAEGARHPGTIEAAVAASPLVITCLSTYDATLAALAPTAAGLRGRTLVTLNSGTPAGARRMAEWASGHGARFLDGAVKDVPTAVGGADTLLYYCGDREVFDEHGPTLRVLGGATVHLGDEPDLASLYETAVGVPLLPALLGFFEGAALMRRRGLTAGALVPYSVRWLEMIASILPLLAEEIDAGHYTDPISTVNTFHVGIPEARLAAEEAGVDATWRAAMDDLLERAVAEGLGERSIATLYELLAGPAPRP